MLSRLKYPVFLKHLFFFIVLFCFRAQGQIVNYVNNGGFEICVDVNAAFKRATYWDALDTNKAFGNLLSHTISPYLVPKSTYTYQWPRHGDNFMISTQYCISCSFNVRGYPRNRLKSFLEAGKTYCFSMYVNLSNKSSYALSKLGVYFGEASCDTINYCTVPLTYLNPHVENPSTNFITDTLGWTLIQGLYTANGSEKYLIVGNFYDDPQTDTLFVNSNFLPDRFASYSFDDVSCIDVELPAFAGKDNSVVPGDSIFIGREPDIGIDESCMWYKLPTIITNTTPAIDTIAGMWVKPTETTTYVVRQEICGNVKWDTVVIYKNPVGIEKLKILSEMLNIYPVPAKDVIELSIPNKELLQEFKSISIYNNLGQFVKEEEFVFTENSYKFKVEDLMPGAYLLQLKSSSGGIVTKRFMVNR